MAIFDLEPHEVKAQGEDENETNETGEVEGNGGADDEDVDGDDENLDY